MNLNNFSKNISSENKERPPNILVARSTKMNASIVPTVLIANASSSMRPLLMNIFAARNCDIVEINDELANLSNSKFLPPLIVINATSDEPSTVSKPYDLCRVLRSTYADERIRILMLAENSEKAVDLAFRAGADDCLTTPIIPSLLERRVDHLLQLSVPSSTSLPVNSEVDGDFDLGLQDRWTLIGQEFFEATVKIIGDKLNYDFVFIGEFDEDAKRVHTIAYYALGELDHNFDYPLEGTPCQHVVGQTVCSYPRGVQALFPDDEMLSDLGIESYIGLPLFGMNGTPLGLVGIMHRQPIENTDVATNMLHLITERASHELDRIRRDNALAKAELFTRAALDGLTSRIAIIDETGTIVTVNHAWREFCPPDQVDHMCEGTNYLDVCDQAIGDGSEDAHLVAETIRAMFSGEYDRKQIEYSFEYEGEPRWYIARFTRLPAAIERPYVIISHQDITNLREAEQTKRVNDATFRSLINDLTVGVMLQGPNAEIIEFNRAATNLLGLTEDQLLGRTSFDPEWNVIHEDGSPFPGDMHPVPTAIRTRKPVYGAVMGVYRPIMKNRVWLWVNAEPQLDERGQVRQVICTFSDITERWNREENIRELNMVLEQLILERTAQVEAEKRQSEMILQNIADGILFTDINANILYANAAWEQTTGYSLHEVIGKNPNFLQSGQTPPALFQEMWNVVSKGNQWSGVFHNRRKDGSIYQSESTIAPVTNAMGVSYFVEIQRDVTEARQLAEIKDRFMANLTHDLGNPVSVLKTSLFLLKRDEAHRDDYLTRIERETNRLADLITDLMTLTEMDRQAFAMTLLPVNLNELMTQVVAQQQPLATEKGLSLTFNPGTMSRPISADAKHLERVVVNLIANAINYTREGKITVTTRQDITHTEFSVRDTGIGINSHDLPHIFERFFRADAARTISKGTGLGLPIVKEIVELHGGKITVHSVAGKGTEFVVCLQNC